MQVFTKIVEIRNALEACRVGKKQIGFVPTMGALHEGHLSLVRNCLSHTDISVVSIYVNPTQFNDPNDLKNYPRNLQSDLEMLEKTGCAFVFAPGDQEMYPEPDIRNFDLGEMALIMEGKHRPGHFNGVAQVVTKLFDIVQPDRAFFGKKDFQQLAIIRKLVADMLYPVEIVGCPIIREHDGLAMSSRNQLLDASQRKAAPLIYKALETAREIAVLSDIHTVDQVVEKIINKHPLLKLDYFQLVDSNTLRIINSLPAGCPVTACIAVKAGSIRLIDNIDLFS
jgi:pantoate--beta-alanine ligase